MWRVIEKNVNFHRLSLITRLLIIFLCSTLDFISPVLPAMASQTMNGYCARKPFLSESHCLKLSVFLLINPDDTVLQTLHLLRQ